MYEHFGGELHTRQMMEHLASSINQEDEYLLDMKGIKQISRSAADELYNLTHGEKRVDVINMEPLVGQMLSAVTLGRFLPRKHNPTDLSIVHFQTVQSAVNHLRHTVANTQ